MAESFRDRPSEDKGGKSKGSKHAVLYLGLAALGIVALLYFRTHSASAQQQNAALQNQQATMNASYGAYNGPVTPYSIYTYGGGGGVGSSFFSGSGTLGSAGTGQVASNGQPVFASSNDTVNGNAYQTLLKNVNSATTGSSRAG